MTDARNVYPRLCWGCLGVIESADHDRALMTYGGYCAGCRCPELPGLRDALRGFTERMNDVSERDELLRETGNARGEAMSDEDMGYMPNTTGNTNCGVPMPSGWQTVTVKATAVPPAVGAYMGNSWFAPQPGIGQQQVYVHSSPPLTEQRVREIIREMLASDELRDAVRAVLEADARELATNPAFQSVYVPATGVCWACGQSGKDDLRWFTRGGQSHLVHDSEECRRLASEKPETTEHRG